MEKIKKQRTYKLVFLLLVKFISGSDFPGGQGKKEENDTF